MSRVNTRICSAVALLALLVLTGLGWAQTPTAGDRSRGTLFHRAENQVQVALVKVVRSAGYTEIHLQTLKAMAGICWYAAGPNSPYLVAGGRRFRYVSGSNVTACPGRQTYANQDVMILRFEPLPASIGEFSLVEGQGGENQMLDQKSSNETFWNFLHVKPD